MFFSSLILRKIASLLQPWLLDEPQLDVKLGFLRSHGIAKNLRFDTSALNRLFDGSSRLFLQDFTVERLIVRISNWSVPAFTFEVHGVHATISVRDSSSADGGSRANISTNTFLKHRKKSLSMIDPEGSALHDALEKISLTSPSRNWFAASLLNVIIKNCQLQMHDIHAQVKIPDSSNCCAFLLDIKDIGAKLRAPEHGCFLSQLISAVIVPVEETHFILDGRGFEIRTKRSDYVNSVFYSEDPFAFIQLKHLQLLNFKLCVPELAFSFSPFDLPILFTFYKLSSYESKSTRSGRQLWELASSRVYSLISAPRSKWYKLADLVGLWLQYVKAYQDLLVRVGFPAEYLFERSTIKMMKEKELLRSVKHQWNLILETEKMLPDKAIAQARRIARCKAVLKFQHASNCCTGPEINVGFRFFLKILPLLGFIWKIMHGIFWSVRNLLLLRISFVEYPKNDENLGYFSDSYCPQVSFTMNLGRISITVSSMHAAQHRVYDIQEAHVGISNLDSLSFSLSIDPLLLVYEESICKQSFSVACGQLTVMSTSIMESLTVESNARNFIGSKGKDNLPNRILWGEPAKFFMRLGDSGSGTASCSEGGCAPFLEQMLGEMWSTWKKSCMKLEESKLRYLEHPCILCETENNLIVPGLKGTDAGSSWRCSLTVGKLNFSLGHSSILSIAVLFCLAQHALCQDVDNQNTNIMAVSHFSRTIEDQPEINLDRRFKPYAYGMETSLLRMLPGKHIQLGMHIAGPHIRISLRNDQSQCGVGDNSHAVSQDDLHFVLNVDDIEVAVCPTLESDLTTSTMCLEFDCAEPQCPELKEHWITDIFESNNDNFVSKGQVALGFYVKLNGLNVGLRVSTENQECQVCLVEPIIVRLCTRRNYLHSFSGSVVAVSGAFCGMAAGFSVSLYVDELAAFFQAMLFLFSGVLHVFTSVELVGSAQCQDLMRQVMALVIAEETQTTAVGASSSSIFMSIYVILTGSFQLKSMDLILYNSRRRNNMEGYINTSDALASKDLIGFNSPDRGIWVSVQHTRVQTSYEEERLGLNFDLGGFHSVIFRYHNQIGERSCLSGGRNRILESIDCLYEISLSSCTFILWMDLGQNASSSQIMSNVLNGSVSRGKTSYDAENSSSPTVNERLSAESSSFCQKLKFTSGVHTLSSSHSLLIEIAISEIFICSCSVKGAVVGVHEPDKLLLTLSASDEFQTIYLEIQGGFLFIEIMALVIFAHCFTSYLSCFSSFLSTVPSFEEPADKAEPGADMTGSHICSTEEYAQGMLIKSEHTKWKLLEACIVDVARLSLVLVTENESGGVEEIVLEAEFCLKLEFGKLRRKFLFDLSRLSILSQILYRSRENEILIPHFSPSNPDLSSHNASRNPPVAFCQIDGTSPHVSCSGDPISERKSSLNDCASGAFHLSEQSYILKRLNASFSLESPLQRDGHGLVHSNQVWVGTGVVSGCDITISLSEVQLVLSMVVSFSGLYGNESSSDVKQKNWPNVQEFDNTLEEAVPNGSIVAIQDVHQHMYITVEGAERKCSLVGAVHYSLVGEKALFRVKYQSRRKWNSQITWFSLISLYAKSDSGEPLQLNYRPGSGFVDISLTNDGGRALWRTLPCKPKSSEGDIDWEPFSKLSRNAFYLVNKKSDCAIAFVDGIPEFVKKPGNPFKFKVFHNLPLTRDVVMPNNYSSEASGSNLRSLRDAQNELLPHIDIAFDKVTLVIVHEVPDTKDKVPLLQGCICNFQSIIQTLSSKVRVMNTMSTMLNCFDAQKNLWRELVHPVETCIFYRSSFQIHGSGDMLQGVPVHLYFKIMELDISLTELSLDILLFVIGKLNVAGPFSVRTSRILANCCKVENQSGLDLLCHFNDNQDIVISRKQASSILLRHLSLEDQSRSKASIVSVQLLVPGTFSTSPIHLSFIEARSLAWRTRVLSLKDTRSYPGPFVIIDISRKTEDGFSVVVSPLIRIHNETQFPLELRFQRPQQKEADSACLLLKPGDAIDDSMAVFDAINLSGEIRKALMSLSVGNFLFSFRPEMANGFKNSKESVSVEWSDDIKGGKAVRLSGLFDKLSYKVRKAFSVESEKCSFSTTHCSLHYGDAHSTAVHFLIQSIRREVPVVSPDKFGDVPEGRSSTVALQEQKEIFILPTVRVSNLLQVDINVLLTETDECDTFGCHVMGSEAAIPCGSTADLYADPASIYFTVTLTSFNSSCKPVNSGECVKKLHKKKNSIYFVDIDLCFGGDGKYFASLRFFRGHMGILEAAVFTPYTLKNDTDFPLLLLTSSHRHTSREEAEKFVSSIAPELGSYLPPKATNSWFLKSNRLCLKLLRKEMYEALLDLDALAGLAEISLETEEAYGFKHTTKLGLSLGASLSNVVVPSQTVTMVPRYIILNESEEEVMVRQCYLEEEMEGIISIKSKQKATLQLRNETSKRRAISFSDNFFRKHRSSNDDGFIFIQFRINETEFGWSGPLCITSLGHFFLKFRRLSDIPLQQSNLVTEQVSNSMQSNQVTAQDNGLWEFAAANIGEEGSSLLVHFHRPLNRNLPYQIENRLSLASITYYQKDSLERDILGSGSSIGYAWDDLTLPHKLVIQINEAQLLREINLDKVRKWKPFFNFRQHKGLASHLLLDKRRRGLEKTNFDESASAEMVKVGYEVYADGPTRVLRISEFPERHKEDLVHQSCAKIQLRVSHITLQLLERGKLEADTEEPSVCTPIIVARLGNISLDCLFTDQGKYNQISIQSLNVDQKWVGAPSPAVLRRHRKDCSDRNDSILQIVVILVSTTSNVKQVKYSTIVLQPVELNLDEETLMRLVPFWRKSLSDSNTQSHQFYFDHFEIHPVKIIASFVPGDSYTNYGTGQETLRSLLHSVIKVPAIKNMVVELNGVLVTHALITIRELFIKCAQHYSWYAMRAIYIAKGSPFLPPAFASIFDDLASSSLDVYFDPSSGWMDIPGLTLGTFKLISRCIHDKGFSGTKRYLGDLGKTLRNAGSNVMFAAVTEISDSVLKGAETSGFKGMVNGFHQGILKLAMEPSVLGTAFMEGGPDRKIKLDRSPGGDELYIEGYLQAMLDTIYKQEYLRVRIIDSQVILKNLPPNSALIDEIMDRVKGFLESKALLRGDSSTTSHPLHHLRGENEWKLGPTVLTLCEHLFVSFAIRILRKRASKLMGNVKWKAIVPAAATTEENKKPKLIRKWGIGKFVLSGMLAYIDGRLCRCIPNPTVRRIVSGFILSFLDKDDTH